MRNNNRLSNALARAPFLRAAVPFIAGLVLGRWAVPGMVAGWAVVIGLFGLWLLCSFGLQQYRLRWVPGAVFFVLLLGLGVFWQALRDPLRRPDHVGVELRDGQGAVVEVVQVASAKEGLVRAWAKVRATIGDEGVQPASGGLLITLLTDSAGRAVQAGDKLVLAGAVLPIAKVPDPGGFDVRQWAASRGVFHECFAPKGRWAFVGPPLEKGGFERLRGRITGWLKASGLPDRERALAKALLLGIRDEMAADQNQAFIRSGTIHVLAVSGSHVGIIYVAVLWGLVFLGKGRRGRWMRGLAALAALWGYAGLTGFEPSVLRATIMFSLFTAAEVARWRTSSLNSLACAAVLLLLWDPQMLVQLGFQLSFLAVLGIIVFYQPILRLWVPPNAVVGFFWSLLAVSLAAQAFTLPLCLYMFRAFPMWFLPANMVIVGLVGVEVYGGILLLAVHAVPVLGPAVALGMKWLLLLLGFLAGFFAELPGAYPAVRVGLWGMAGMYVLLVCGSFWLLQRSRWARMGTMAMLAVLLFGWARTAHLRNAQQGFAVYQSKDGVTGSVVQGRTLYAFSTTRTDRAGRSIGQHAREVGAYRVVRMDSLPLAVKQGHAVYLFQDAAGVPGATSPGEGDVVVFHGKGRRGQALMPDRQTGQWVLCPDLGWKARTGLLHRAAELKVPVFDMREQGAYVRP